MPKNNVYLKDLHYDYLEEKGYDFALTDSYKEHEAFFDRLKKEHLPDIEDTSLENPIAPPIAIEFLKDMVVNKYFDTNEFSSGNLELSQASWFYLQARARLSNKMKSNYVKLKKVDRQISSIIVHDVPTNLRVLDSPFELDSFLKSSDQNKIETLKKKPLDTGNHVHDVIKQQKFYHEVSIDPIKYDDLQFKILSDTVAGKINYFTPFNPSFVRKKMKNRDKDFFKSIEIEAHIDWVKKSIVEKYSSPSDVKDSLNLFNANILRKNMLNLLSIKNSSEFRIESYFSSDFGFGLTSLELPKVFPSNCIIKICMEDSSFFEKVSLNEEGRFVIHLNRYAPFSINILYHDDNRNFTLKSLFSSNYFSVEKYVFSDSSEWVIPVCDYMDGYFLEYPTTKIIKEVCLDGKLHLIFSGKESGSVFILNNAKNSLGRKNIRLTNSNVNSILPTVDFIKDKFELWIQ